MHCVQRVLTRKFSGPYFLVFWLNTGNYIPENFRALFIQVVIPRATVEFWVINSVHQIDPFFLNAPFLHPLETSENRKVFCCFQGVEKWCIGNGWVKIMKKIFSGTELKILKRNQEKRAKRKDNKIKTELIP